MSRPIAQQIGSASESWMTEQPDALRQPEREPSNNRSLELGNKGVGRLLLDYAIPSIIAMCAMSLYNIIDSIFVGHGVGSAAISALAIALPIMSLSVAISTMIGVGAAALMSIRLGQGDTKSTNLILGNAVMASIAASLIAVIIIQVFLGDILLFFGASNETMGYARAFMRIILWGNPISMLNMCLNSTLRASGFPRRSMAIMLSSVVINVILAPIFIFVLHWGIRGTALATVMAQAFSLCLQLAHFLNPRHAIRLKRECFVLRLYIIKDILSIGLAPFTMNICTSIIVIFINKALASYGGDDYIGAYGIINRIAFLFSMTVIGLTQGLQPIVGYNYGARRYDRVRRALKLGIASAMCVTTAGFLISELFPGAVAGLFTSDPVLYGVTRNSLPVVMILFPIVGFQMVSSNFFMSIGKAKKAMFLTLTRQIIFLLPLLVILPPYLGTLGVWISMPMADLFSSALTLLFILRQLRSLGYNLPLSDDR